MIVDVYTDGSAVVAGKNKGKGGFGVYFPLLNGEPKAYSLGFRFAKTGQMEVMALKYAIMAMPKSLDTPVQLNVYSDSEYVVKSFTENRLKKWIANGWNNSSGVVKNLELWKDIVELLGERSEYLTISLIHIRSHQVEKAKTKEEKDLLMKDPHVIGNMKADMLADYKRHQFFELRYK
jgi:ribonuclease HI